MSYKQTAGYLVMSVFCLHSVIVVFIYMIKSSGERPHPSFNSSVNSFPLCIQFLLIGFFYIYITC